MVRNEIKRKEEEYDDVLTKDDKGNLRSRREAKVSRAKLEEYDRAILNAFKWLICEHNNYNLNDGKGGIYQQIESERESNR